MSRGPWISARALAAWVAAAALQLAPACLMAPALDEDAMRADGTQCASDDECRTGVCTSAHLCSHSSCNCPGEGCAPEGEPAAACADGWVCVYYESVFESVGEVFDIEHDMDGGLCQPLCEAGCPEHYTCRGRFCAPDADWVLPVPTVRWTGAADGTLSGHNQTTELQVEAGRPVVLTASATSPIAAEITSYQWTVTAGSGERVDMEGTRVELSAEPGSYRRAELSVVDAEVHAALITVTLTACSGAGEACGYQGSGCCSGCDSATHTCL
jgi:hypothetical protein